MSKDKETINLHPVAIDKPMVPFGPAAGGPSTLTPAQAKDTKREKTVNMMFSKRVHLTVEHGKIVVFNAGVQPVPVHLSNHPWLKRNGVEVHKPTPAPDGYVQKFGEDEAAEQKKRDDAFKSLVSDQMPKTSEDEEESETETSKAKKSTPVKGVKNASGKGK